MIVLDASVLIGYLDARDAHHDRASALLTREIEDDFARLASFDDRIVTAARALGVDVAES